MCDPVDEAPWCSEHIPWLVPVAGLETEDGRPVEMYEFRHEPDPNILSAWARHFRNHYCLDSEIDVHRAGTKLSRCDFLQQIKFPDRQVAPGPSLRSGDFAEILVTDYLEYILQFWVPRVKQAARAVRNQSTQGSDVVGFRITDAQHPSPDDTLAIFEVKAQLSQGAGQGRLQDAVDGSIKDEYRLAETLSAIKQRLYDKGLMLDQKRVERFQSPEDNTYQEEYGAVAVFTVPSFDQNKATATTTDAHPKGDEMRLVIVVGNDMMRLVHELYERAANEA